jgi:alpha-tubulin suppressor-like RCC1 family protein
MFIGKRCLVGLVGVMVVTLGASVVRADVVCAWGGNDYGQLGNGTTTKSSVPVAVSGLSGDVTSIAAGMAHSLAIQNGAAYAWGSNSQGKLGDGTTTNSSVPVAVSGLSAGVTDIAGGYSFSLAVKDGAAYAWGANDQGQLGNGTTTPAFSAVPVVISGLSSNVTAVAAGNNSGIALRDGAVYRWAGVVTPTVVTGLSSGVTDISSGSNHGLAIKNGALFAWGQNSYGQLGDGTKTSSFTAAVAVSGMTSGVSGVAGGTGHSLALKDGLVYAWGLNGGGQLGNGTTTDSLVPVLVPGLSDIVAIAAGSASYALGADGSLWAWGSNSSGQLGDGTTSGHLTPEHLFAPPGYRFVTIDGSDYGGHVLATIAPVPEPASLAVLALGAVALLRRHRRRKR